MIKKSSQKRRGISQKEIERFFEKLNHYGTTFPNPTPKYENSSSDWVTIGGSSQQKNELVKVSIWQTGQTS